MTAHEASSSSSSKSELWSYDVFLNFSGEDTRNGFTSHLHEALKNRGYHVFIDEDGLKRGEEIKERLFRAIEESRISVIVFSKMYADSSWCLDELVKIMECRDKLGRHVLPIFYHVDPSHVRKQDGDLAEAFQKHEKDIREEKDDKKREAKQERVKQWREALTKAANLSGHHLQGANNRMRWREAHTEATNLSDHQTTGNRHEAEFIKKIVDKNIWKWLPRTNELHVAKHPIGIESRIQGGISVLRERCLVTVEGNKLNMHDLLREMAKVIISEKSHDHPGKWSRLWNHQEVTDVLTNKSGTGKIEGLALHFDSSALDVLQNRKTVPSFSTKAFAKMKKLRLLDLCNVQLNGEYKHLPKELIWLRWEDCPLKSIPDDFFSQDKLVVLDMQWSELEQVWEGSKSLHNLKTLDLSDSWSLQKSPDFSQVPNLEELILENCESLSEIHPSIGHLKRLSLVNLTGCNKLISLPGDFYKLKSVETLLLNGCSKFIELDEDIGEMISLRTLEAKQTAIREVPPSIVRLKNLTRLSIHSISVKHTVEELIWLRWEKCPLKSIPDDFFNQDKLVVLEMKFSKLVQVWEGSKSLHNLKTLDLSHSNSLQKSPDFSPVPNLEELILKACSRLSEIHPSISHLKRLSLVNLNECRELISLPRDFYKSKSVETLLLNGCWEFKEVHEDIGEMISLRTLEAEETAIREVPPSIVGLKNLTRLSLDRIKGEYKHLPKELIRLRCKGCPLKSIPDDFFNQDKLVVLEMKFSKLVQVWEGSKSLHNLKTLDLSHSLSLQKSPDFSQIPNLEELILENCQSLSEIHPSIGHLKRLSLVNLESCRILISLPRDFYKSKSVETLFLNYCRKFREVHEDIGEMISLRTLEAEQTAIRKVPPSIVGLKNLTRLSLDRISVKLTAKELIWLRWEECPLKSMPDDFFNQDKLVVLEMPRSKLVQVWEGSKSLHNLKTLDLSDSYSLQKSPDFSQVPNLEELILDGCLNLSEIHPSIGHLKRLSLVNLEWCDKLVSLPRDFYKLKSVETLLLNDCSKFRELHEDIGEMISLRTLEAEDTAIREVPPSIVKLKNLTRLSLYRTMRSI